MSETIPSGVAATAALPAYSVLSVPSAEDAGRAAIDVWRGNLGRAEELEAKYRWFYRANPAGPGQLMLLARDGEDAPVGVLGLGPRDFSAAGVPVQAAVLADFAVLPRHRSLYPALLLQRCGREDGLRRFGMVYGFPNRRAAPVLARAGYRKWGEVGRHVAVLRTQEYLTRVLPRSLAATAAPLVDAAIALWRALRRPPGWRASWIDQPDGRFTALWNKARAGGWLIGRRDREFLAWRFSQPARRFRFLVLERRGDVMVGYAACERIDRVMNVRDFLFDPAHPRALLALLTQLQCAARADGCTSVHLEFFGDGAVLADLVRAGFVRRDGRPLFVSATAMPAGEPFITSADEDQ
jgi:hypothetical protein